MVIVEMSKEWGEEKQKKEESKRKKKVDNAG